LLKNKGFVKKVLTEFCKLPNNVRKLFFIDYYPLIRNSIHERNESSLIVKNIKSNNCSNDSLEKCIQDKDVYGILYHVRPKIALSEYSALKTLTRDGNNIIKHIESQEYIILTNASSVSNIEENTNLHSNAVDIFNDRKNAIQNHYNLIKSRLRNNVTCNICLDKITNRTILRCCMNSFCLVCINTWFCKYRVCPLCKSRIDLYKDQLVILNQFTSFNDIYNVSLKGCSIITNIVNTVLSINNDPLSLVVILNNDDFLPKIMSMQRIPFVCIKNTNSLNTDTHPQKMIIVKDDGLFSNIVLNYSMVSHVIFNKPISSYIKTCIVNALQCDNLKGNKRNVEIIDFSLV
jgi:hypothetical protein